jgi:RNA polymerase sigma-70 factor (ECF subfamily)
MATTTVWGPERFRPLLHLQVRLLGIDPLFRRRFDSSDVVQETLLKAHKNRDQFRGTTEAELVRWLQVILRRVALDKVKKEGDVRLEASLHEALDQSSSRLHDCLHARGPAPDEQAQQQEFLRRLDAALDRLSEDQREVFILRDLRGAPVRQIAEQMGRSEKAVADLLFRGRRKLKELLGDAR